MNLLSKYFTFLLLILFLISACEKIPFDWRNKYVGNYKFTYQEQNMSGCPFSADSITSGEYNGKIYYNGKKDGKDDLHIIFAGNTEVVTTLDVNDSIKGDCSGTLRGKFQDKKSVNFTVFTPCFTHCSHTSYTVTGKKTK
jgi:hypothetical protein